VPELVVINKSDSADPVAIKALELREHGAVSVSARTGAGIDRLRAVVDEALPVLDREVRAVVPYDRGDLVARVHAAGAVQRVEHGPAGTLVEARVPAELATELAPFGAPAVAVTASAR
jgi:GTP-binding protein HflX